MRLRVAVFVCVLLILGLGFPNLQPAQAVTGSLQLSELLVDPASPQTDAHDEFIEFHNIGSTPLSLGDYKLRIGTSATLYSLPQATLPVDGYIAVTSGDPASKWALTNSGSTITLLDTTGSPIDTTTWTKAVTGASWMRDAQDKWSWTSTTTPDAANVLSLPSTSPTSTTTPQSSYEPGAYPEVELNELLPDPASPQTDAADEFVEIYNPNAEPVDLAGYVVKTGSSLGTKHTLGSVIVPPAGYIALKSANTKVSLANDGSSVALFDPSGRQLGATVSYGKAKTGYAWARSDNESWGWTTMPTPNAANIMAAPSSSSATAASSSKSSSSKSSTSSKTTKSTTTKTKAKTTTTPKSTAQVAATATSSGGHWLLFALAGLTIGYIIYEFRYDIRNFYYRFRRHSGSRGKTIPLLKGRGGD